MAWIVGDPFWKRKNCYSLLGAENSGTDKPSL